MGAVSLCSGRGSSVLGVGARMRELNGSAQCRGDYRVGLFFGWAVGRNLFVYGHSGHWARVANYTPETPSSFLSIALIGLELVNDTA